MVKRIPISRLDYFEFDPKGTLRAADLLGGAIVAKGYRPTRSMTQKEIEQILFDNWPELQDTISRPEFALRASPLLEAIQELNDSHSYSRKEAARIISSWGY